MRIRYIDQNGKESSFAGRAEFDDAISAGTITLETMVFHDGKSVWVKARDFDPDPEPDPVSESAKRFVGKRGLAWIIIVASIVFYSFSGVGGARAGEVLAQVALFALVVAAIFWAMGRKRPDSQKANFSLAAAGMLAVFLLFQTLSDKLKEHQTRAAVQALTQVGKNTLQAQQDIISGNEPKRPATLQPPIPITTPTSGANLTEADFLRLTGFIIQDISARILREQQRIAKEIETMRLDTLLRPEALTTRGGIESNRVKIKRWEQLVDEDARNSKKGLDELRQRTGAVAAGSPFEESFSVYFERGAIVRIEAERRLLEKSRALTKTAKDLNEYMAGMLGKTTISNGQIIFQTQAEADTYNAFIKQVVTLAGQVEKLTHEYQEMAMDHFNNTLDIVNKAK